MGASQSLLLSMGGGAPGLPLIAGQVLHLMASQYTGTDGELVSTWSDQSPKAKHATQAGALRPTYETEGVFPVMRFSGTKFMNIAGATGGVAASSVFIVLKSVDTTNDYILDFTPGSDTPAIVQGYSAGNYSLFQSAVHTVIRAISTTAYVRLTSTGALAAAINVWLLCAATGGAAPFTGDIAEVIVYDTVLSAGNLAAVNAYLDEKFSL